MGVCLILRHFLVRGFSHWSAAPALTPTVIARSDVVEEGTIVTAVAVSSDKVGGSGTQFASPEPLARSVHHGPLLPRRVSFTSAWKKKKFKIFEMSLVTTAVRTVHPVRIPLQRARSANALRCRSGAPSSSRRLALEKS